MAFAAAAARYWLSVYPRVRREARHWQGRAQRIPDPTLRRLALATQLQERGNLEGAAAFAVLAPRAQRARVVRAVVAFQVIYDYADTLAEQPSSNPAGNGRELHRALASALDPDTEHPHDRDDDDNDDNDDDDHDDHDYYAHSRHKDDGGYLRELVEACQSAFGALPSHASLTAHAQVAVRRIVAFQELAHGGEDGDGATGDNGDNGDHEDAWQAFSQWAAAQTPQGSGLQWWETAAGAASSLLIFALIACAAEPSVSEGEIAAIEQAYFPWIGGLHLLLDSLVDRADDVRAGRYSLVEHYSSPRELAERLRAIAAEALCAAGALPHSSQHELILAAMASYYLTQPAASSPEGAPARAEILATLGERAMPTMRMLRARRSRRGRRRESL
jgi:tetraprenyl-beta-curcumene synthase